MNRLSLADLKAQKGNQVSTNLESINGGNAAGCHCQSQGATPGQVLSDMWQSLSEPFKFFASIYNDTHEPLIPH